MHSENAATEDFANMVLPDCEAGFHSDAGVPAMATPATPGVIQFVIVGSTICLVC